MPTDSRNATGSNDEKTITANGVDLCVETFGDPVAPPILLIGGAASSMDWWEDAFCQQLAAGFRFIIRYDHRDTGRSISYPPGKPGYTGRDLDTDALGLLDSLGIGRAHLAGLSMGGGIAQTLALEHPDRVATLTLFSTSPAVSENLELPPIADRLKAVFAEPAQEPDWSDREAVVAYLVDGERPFVGSIPFDEQHVRAIATRVVNRTVNIQSSTTNHWTIEGGEPVKGRLAQIAAPTLVFHGTEDPMFPPGHGEALAREIPVARLIPLEGMGHQYPPHQLWDIIIAAMLEHTTAKL